MKNSNIHPAYSAPTLETCEWALSGTVLSSSGQLGLQELQADENDNTFFI